MSPKSCFVISAVIAASLIGAGCAHHAAPTHTTTTTPTPTPTPTHHLITYQVIGSCSTATIKFTDADGNQHKEANVPLPFVKSFDMHNGSQASIAAMIHGAPTDAVYVGVNSDDHQIGECGATVSDQYQIMSCRVENDPFPDASSTPSAANTPPSNVETASQFCAQIMKNPSVASAYADSSSPPTVTVQFRPSISRRAGSMVAYDITNFMLMHFMAPKSLQIAKVVILDGKAKPLCSINHDRLLPWSLIMASEPI